MKWQDKPTAFREEIYTEKPRKIKISRGVIIFVLIVAALIYYINYF